MIANINAFALGAQLVNREQKYIWSGQQEKDMTEINFAGK